MISQTIIPALIASQRGGDLSFYRLLRFHEFEDINKAAEATYSGETIKAVLHIGSP